MRRVNEGEAQLEIDGEVEGSLRGLRKQEHGDYSEKNEESMRGNIG